MEERNTLHTFITAMLFYDQLLGLDDEELKARGFSTERINQGIERLKQMYDV